MTLPSPIQSEQEKLRKNVAIHMGKGAADPAVEAVMRTVSNFILSKKAEAIDTPELRALMAENKRLVEAGDALYERASYTGREFDGCHRLLSAAAHWLDVRGKNSGEYQAKLAALTPKTTKDGTKCPGAHCKCMDNDCPHFHSGDHNCPFGATEAKEEK